MQPNIDFHMDSAIKRAHRWQSATTAFFKFLTTATRTRCIAANFCGRSFSRLFLCFAFSAAGENQFLILRLSEIFYMFGFGYLMVPIYNVFCDITGLNGKTGKLSTVQASQLEVDQTRMVKVEFTGTLNENAPLDNPLHKY